jgi:hypothetical protein
VAVTVAGSVAVKPMVEEGSAAASVTLGPLTVGARVEVACSGWVAQATVKRASKNNRITKSRIMVTRAKKPSPVTYLMPHNAPL